MVPAVLRERNSTDLDIVLTPCWGTDASVGSTGAELVGELVGWPSAFRIPCHPQNKSLEYSFTRPQWAVY